MNIISSAQSHHWESLSPGQMKSLKAVAITSLALGILATAAGIALTASGIALPAGIALLSGGAAVTLISAVALKILFSHSKGMPPATSQQDSAIRERVYTIKNGKEYLGVNIQAEKIPSKREVKKIIASHIQKGENSFAENGITYQIEHLPYENLFKSPASFIRVKMGSILRTFLFELVYRGPFPFSFAENSFAENFLRTSIQPRDTFIKPRNTFSIFNLVRFFIGFSHSNFFQSIQVWGDFLKKMIPDASEEDKIKLMKIGEALNQLKAHREYEESLMKITNKFRSRKNALTKDKKIEELQKKLQEEILNNFDADNIFYLPVNHCDNQIPVIISFKRQVDGTLLLSKFSTGPGTAQTQIIKQENELSQIISLIIQKPPQIGKLFTGEISVGRLHKKEVSPESIVEIFIKTLQPELYEEKKIVLHATLLIHLFKKGKKELNNRELRQWMRHHLILLIETLRRKEVKKADSAPSERIFPGEKFLLKRLEKMLKYIEQIEKRSTNPLAPAPKKQGVSNNPFHAPHVESLTLKGTKLIAPFVAQTESPLAEIDFSKRANALTLLRRELEISKGDLRKKDFGMVDAQLNHLLHIMTRSVKEKRFENLTLNEAVEWNQFLKEFSSQAVLSHYGQKRIYPEPNTFSILLLSLSLSKQFYLQQSGGYRLPLNLQPIFDRLWDKRTHQDIFLKQNLDRFKEISAFISTNPNSDHLKYDLCLPMTFLPGGSDLRVVKREEKKRLGVNQVGRIPTVTAPLFSHFQELGMLLELIVFPNIAREVKGISPFQISGGFAEYDLSELFSGVQEISFSQKKFIVGLFIKEYFNCLNDKIILDPYFNNLGGSSYKNISDQLLRKRISLYFLHGSYHSGGKYDYDLIVPKHELEKTPSDLNRDFQLLHVTDWENAFKEAIGKLAHYGEWLNEGEDSVTLKYFLDCCIFNRSLVGILDDPSFKSGTIKTLKETAQQMIDTEQYRSYLYLLDLCQRIRLNLDSGVQDEKLENLQALDDLIATLRSPLSDWIEKAEQKIEPFIQYRRDFYQFYLLGVARSKEEALRESLEPPQLSQEEMEKCLQGAFMLQVLQKNPLYCNAQQDLAISSFLYRMRPNIQEFLQGDISSFCNGLVERIAGEKHEGIWNSPEGSDSGFALQSEGYVLDFVGMDLWCDGERHLPLTQLLRSLDHDTQEALKRAIHGVDLTVQIDQMVIVCRPVEQNEMRALEYSFSVGKDDKRREFRIHLSQNGEQKIFRSDSITPNQWYFLQPSTKHFPECDLWVREDGKLFHFDLEGQLRYRGVKRKSEMQLFDCLERKDVLFPWKFPEFRRFLEIERKDNIHGLGQKGKVDGIRYKRCDLKYDWNPELQRWEAGGGYYLSSQPLFTQSIGDLFSPGFTHYHLQEHDNQFSRLVLTGVPYNKRMNAPLVPSYDQGSEKEIPLLTYTIDPQKGLVADQIPEGYLYLAYLLLTQGKYEDAVRYLEKGALQQTLSEHSKQILDWMVNYQSKEPEWHAFQLHLGLFMQKQSSTNLEERDLSEFLGTQFEIYQRNVALNLIPDALKLRAADQAELERMVADGASSLEERQAKEIGHYYQVIEQKKTEWIDKPQRTLPSGEPTSIVLFPSLIAQNYFYEGTEKREIVSIDEFQKGTQQEIEKLADPYSQSMGNEIIEDLKNVPEEEENKRVYQCRSPELLMRDLENLQRDLRNRSQELKLQIMQQLNSYKASTDWARLRLECRQRNLNESEVLFDTALLCYGEGDWSPFGRELGVELEVALKESVHEYLKLATAEKELRPTIALSRQLREMNVNTANSDYLEKSNELYRICTAQRHYNPDQDSDAPVLLLLEYELGFTIRKSNVEMARTTLNSTNLFKQEVCGGGKTAVLRHLVSYLRANGVSLSGISTLEPLKAIHGPIFSKITLHAFGQHAYSFHFSRGDRSDLITLRQIELNLLKTIVEKGRLGVTRGDLQSFLLEQTLKMEQIYLSIDPQEKYQLHQEIDTMDRVLLLLKNHARINADEIDEDCDPTQEKNYGHGKWEPMTQSSIDAVLELAREIFTDKSSTFQKYLEAIKSNQVVDLDEQSINRVRWELANRLFDRYKDKLDLLEEQRELFCRYMTESALDKKLSPQEIVEIDLFSKNCIIPKKGEENQAKEMISFCHQYLAEILPTTSKKKGGVDFGRAKDGIHIVPFAGSDKPKEQSQHVLEAQQLWFACLSFADTTAIGGIHPDQIAQIAMQARKSAAEEIRKERYLHPDQFLTMEDTVAAKKFFEDFGLQLFSLKEEDYAKIASAFQDKPEKLVSFLREFVISKYRMKTEKIVSDAQDPVGMVLEYSGASGTDFALHTLPKEIDVTQVRQPGVHGSILKMVFKNQLENEESGISTYIPFSSMNGALKSLAKELKGGDCICDVAKLFPGIPAAEIAVMLNKNLQEEGKGELVIRYMNREDQWKMLKEGKVVPLDDKFPLNQVITLFDDTHTRGVDRPSMKGVTEYMTLDEHVPLSNFEQAALRERGVMRGEANIRYLIPEALKKPSEREQCYQMIAQLCKKEAERLRPLNNKAEKQRIRALRRNDGIRHGLQLVTQKALLEGSEDHHVIRERTYAQSRNCFVKKTQITAVEAGSVSEMKNPQEELKSIAKREKDLVEDLIKELKETSKLDVALTDLFISNLESVKEALERKEKEPMNQTLLPLLTAQKRTENSLEMDDESTQENEQEHLQEAIAQQDVQVEHEEVIIKLSLGNPFNIFDCEEDDFDQLLNGIIPDQLKERLHLFSSAVPYQPSGKFYTGAFVSIEDNHTPWSAISNRIATTQNPISRSIFVIHPASGRVAEIISTRAEFNLIDKYIQSKADQLKAAGFLISTYNYDSHQVDGGVDWSALSPGLVKKLMQYVISSKFQNWEVIYPDFSMVPVHEKNEIESIIKNQYSMLLEWLLECRDENGDPVNLAEMEARFKREQLTHRPSNVYADSDLERAFKEVKAQRACG